MSKRWLFGVRLAIALFVVTNFTIYSKVYFDRKGDPLYKVAIGADEIHFPYSQNRPSRSFSDAAISLKINLEPWIESHSNLKALQVLGFCDEPSEKKRYQKKWPILALIELGGPNFDTLKEKKKKEWETCVEVAKKEKSGVANACDWQEGDYAHLSRLMLKEVFLDEAELSPYRSEGNKFLVLRGTIHAYGCTTNSEKFYPYVSLESGFSVPDQFKKDVDKAIKDDSKGRPFEAVIAVGHQNLLRLNSFRFYE